MGGPKMIIGLVSVQVELKINPIKIGGGWGGADLPPQRINRPFNLFWLKISN